MKGTGVDGGVEDGVVVVDEAAEDVGVLYREDMGKALNTLFINI